MTILSTHFDLLIQGLFGSFCYFMDFTIDKKMPDGVDVGWTSGVAILAVLVVCHQIQYKLEVY